MKQGLAEMALFNAVVKYWKSLKKLKLPEINDILQKPRKQNIEPAPNRNGLIKDPRYVIKTSRIYQS